MDFRTLKKLTIDGVELKQLFINGVQVWKGVNYTNQIPISTDKDGSIYNGKGYKENTYDNNGNVGTNNGTALTGFIPCKAGDVIRLQKMPFNTSVSNCRLTLYKADKTLLGQYMVSSGWFMNTVFKGVKDSAGNYIQWTIENSSSYAATAFVRITAASITAASVVTINQVIE